MQIIFHSKQWMKYLVFHPALNAGFLVIRPNKIIFDALLSMFFDEVNINKRGTSEQQMLRNLWNGSHPQIQN